MNGSGQRLLRCPSESTEIRRGGSYPSLSGRGGYPSPPIIFPAGTPTHPSWHGRGTHPPPVPGIRTGFRVECRRELAKVRPVREGGVVPPPLAGGVGTPPQQFSLRGTLPPSPGSCSPGGRSRKPKRPKEIYFRACFLRYCDAGSHFAFLLKTGTCKNANETQKNLPRG